MNILKPFLAIPLLCIFIFGYSQDTIITLDGSVIPAYGYTTQESSGEISYKTKSGKLRYFYFDEVFSIKNANGEKTYIYKVNDEAGIALSQENMEEYLNGIIAAKKQFNTPFTTLTSLGLGATSSFITQSAFWGPVIPGLNTGITSFIAPSEKRILKHNPNKKDSEYFIKGYKEKGKNIRIRNSIIGGVVGYIGGAAAYIFVFK